MKGCKNLNSPPTGIWPQAAEYTKIRRPDPPPNLDNMGFPEQMKHYTDPNFLFNVPFSQENGNSPDSIYQVPDNAKEIVSYDGNAGNYDDWDDFGAMQDANVNDVFDQSDFGFPEMDHFSAPEPIDQQCFWTKDFGKQVSEALNMATSAASWTPHPGPFPPKPHPMNPPHPSTQLKDYMRNQEREQSCTEDAQMMLVNDCLFDRESCPRKIRPISSLSSSSTESHGDMLASAFNAHMLNIPNISEGQECFPPDFSQGHIKVPPSKINPNAPLNPVSHAYQNFPRNLSSRYNSFPKAMMIPPQTASETDYLRPPPDNMAAHFNNNNSFEQAKNAHNFDKMQFQHTPQPKAPGFCCIKQPDNFKNYTNRAHNMACLDKTPFLQEHEKTMRATNKFPIPNEVLQSLSNRTIAGLYAFGLYRDMLHADAEAPKMKYPPHVFNSPPDSVFELCHPYVHRRGHSSMYSAKDAFFGQTSPAFFPVPPTFIGMRTLRRSGPSNELHLRLEECYEQFRHLEKERKKTEAELARQNPGKKVSSANTIPIPRLTPNPSRVDRLIIDELREHAKMVTLIAKMEQLRKVAVHPNIHVAMEEWLEAVRGVQARRRDEILSVAHRPPTRTSVNRIQEDKNVVALAAAIMELSRAARQARTAMWCALVATVLFDVDPEVAAAHDLQHASFDTKGRGYQSGEEPNLQASASS